MNRWNRDSACSPAKPALPPGSFSWFAFFHLSWHFILIATGWKCVCGGGMLRDPHATEGLSWTFFIMGEKLPEHVTSCTGMKSAITNLLFSPEKCLASTSPEEIYNQNKMAEGQIVLQCLEAVPSHLGAVSIWQLSGLRRSSGKASHQVTLYRVLLLPFQPSEIYVKGCLTLYFSSMVVVYEELTCIWRTVPLWQLSSHFTVMVDHAVLFCGSCHIFQDASERGFPSWQVRSKEDCWIEGFNIYPWKSYLCKTSKSDYSPHLKFLIVCRRGCQFKEES